MIYVTGDTHGYFNRLMKRLEDNKVYLNKDDILIVTGDFGFVWDDPLTVEEFKKIVKIPFTIAFADGNHEKFPLINYFPVTEWNGGKVHRIGLSENIIHLMRGQAYNIGGKSFFVMGGAFSVDRADRHEGIEWFPEELPGQKEYDTARETLERHNNSFDYIITHTIPSSAMRQLGFEPDPLDAKLTDFLQQVYENTEFRQWFAGHFHRDEFLLDGKLRILLNDVVKID